MKYLVCAINCLFAGCGTVFPGERTHLEQARSTCRAAEFPNDFINGTISSVPGIVLLVESELAGRPEANDPSVIANLIVEHLIWMCIDRFGDSDCGSEVCFEIDIDCCSICDFDEAVSLNASCIECTGAILEATLSPSLADAARERIDQLMEQFVGLGSNLCP